MIPASDRQPRLLELTPELMVAAYCQGLFPMARSRHDGRVEWFSPPRRAVVPLDCFNCPRNVRQSMDKGIFEIRYDTEFEQVIRSCAAPRPGHPQTWINGPITRCFIELHDRGWAHSVEAWRDGRLVGGLYGVALAGAFFGESMFCRPDLGGSNSSKICLVHLVQRLNERGFVLLDAQINSDHMKQFGTVDIPRAEYLRRLQEALRKQVTW
jgi:leucyl/phenylalanyl-tRNA---protein transferase